MGLQAHDHRGLHGGHAGRGKRIDGAGARRQDQADADEGRTDGRRPEMDRGTAGRQGGWTDCTEELNHRVCLFLAAEVTNSGGGSQFEKRATELGSVLGALMTDKSRHFEKTPMATLREYA